LQITTNCNSVGTVITLPLYQILAHTLLIARCSLVSCYSVPMHGG